MFDTSVVRARAIAAPRTATLAISVVIHSIAIVAAVALTLTSTPVPSDPPKQMELYRPVEPPPAPPAPLGVRRAAAPPVPRAKERVANVPHVVTAPQVIPDQVPVVPSTAATATSLAPAAATGTAVGPIGEPGGDKTGVPGGTGTGPGVGQGPHAIGERGLIPPHALTKVEPQFPPLFRNAMSTTVVVRCVIGKDGRIHDPEIVKSSFTPFNDAVMQALRQWTFEPGKMNGEAVDTYFVLTVNFEIRR